MPQTEVAELSQKDLILQFFGEGKLKSIKKT